MPFVVIRPETIDGKHREPGEVLPDDTFNIGGLVHLGIAQYFQDPAQAQRTPQQQSKEK